MTGIKQCFLTPVRLPTIWLSAWPVVLRYVEYTVANAHILSPCFVLRTAGLEVAVGETEAAPGQLFFELRKPPQHGVLLKYTAEFPGPMAAGICLFCYWPAWRGLTLQFFVTQTRSKVTSQDKL